MLDPIAEISTLYGIEQSKAILLMHKAIEEVLGYPVIGDSVTENGSIVFFANRGSKHDEAKKIRLSPLLQKRTKIILERLLERERLKKQTQTQKHQIIDGIINLVKPSGIEINTRFGKAFAPRNLLIKEEESFYKEGIRLEFHIYKLTDTVIILDRLSRYLTINTLKSFLPDVTIYNVKRKNGKQLKVYASSFPSKEQFELIRMAFVEKHIHFVIYNT